MKSSFLTSQTPQKSKKYPATVRLWHWANLLVISGSLATVLVNSLLFDHQQRSFVRSQLSAAGAAVTDHQAGAVIHGMEDQVWRFHIYFGYALSALFLFRLAAEFFLPPQLRLLTKLKSVFQSYKALKKQREQARHELIVKGLYAIFYLFLIIMVVSGLLLAFEDQTGFSENLNHSIKEFHGFCMYLIIIFIILHIAGVLLAERKEDKGIVSDMINGGER